MDVTRQVSKYTKNATAPTALQNYKDGVAGVTEAPTHKAARKLDKYLASITEAVQSGRMRDSLMATSLSDYQEMASQKAGNYTQGVKLGAAKYARFAQAFGPLQTAVTDRVNSMPDTTLEERLAKSREQAIATAALKGKWRGRFTG